MTYVLGSRERKALKKFAFLHQDFLIPGQLGTDIGKVTIGKLLEFGLIEVGSGTSHSSMTGWRITQNGWRCMYGKTYAEIMQGPPGQRELKIWSWPPTLD